VIFCGLGANLPGGNISGRNPLIAEMVELAGGINPITQFEGFRPLTEEGMIAAAPDIIVMSERSLERAGGLEGVRKLPGVALTPAGRSGRVIPVSDMYFQGFGPGMKKVAIALYNQFFLVYNALLLGLQ
jgi:iron complex transport system substrate-binding protein